MPRSMVLNSEKPVSTNARDLFKHCVKLLKASHIDATEKETEIIFKEVLNIDLVSFYKDNPVISPSQINKIDDVISRRLHREPLQYILGHTDFFGLRLKVGSGVLIPRPETEILVEETMRVSDSDNPSILDLCTGSGAIALALAKRIQGSSVTGTDISIDALKYAHLNKELLHIDNVRFLEGRLFEPVKGFRFDIIVSNPPYIKKDELPALQPEIANWEPKEALDGGIDGLDFYREILSNTGEYLNPGGRLLFELGAGQSSGIINIAASNGFEIVDIVKDLGEIERVLILQCRK